MTGAAPASAAVPSAPTNVRTSDVTASSVRLSWSSVSGASSYDVRLGGYSAKTKKSAFNFTQLQPCTTYTLGVRARNRSGASAWVDVSAKTTGCATAAAPAPPANVTTSSITDDSMLLGWSAASGASSYDVHLETYQDSAAGTSYDFTELQPCTAYTLGVRSRNAAGTSPWVDVTATTTGCAADPAPTPSPTASPTPSPTPSPSPSPGSGLHVWANKLLDAEGAAVQLHGVNRSGTEYACIQGWGVFDGPSDDASIAAMRAWNANVVHIGLNEDCILGINGVSSQYSGAGYMNAVVDFVKRLHAQGMYAEVSLMWAAPGTQKAEGHPQILDQDHAPAALEAIANAFKSDPETIIGLQSEPHGITWACWRDGGSSCSVGYAALGMQGALDAVRSAGATNVVTVSGIDWANDLSQWLTHAPTDPAGQLMAEAHVYGGNSCASTSCFDADYAPVAAQVPLVFGETGEDYDGASCGSTNVAQFMNWADAHGVGYEPWVWDTWGTCGSLISDYSGTPANAYGSYVRSHLLSRP